MGKFFTRLLNMFKKDENAYSAGRVAAVLAFFLWGGVSLHLAIACKTWGNYEAFTMGAISFMLAQLGNKYIETRSFKVTKGE